MLYAKAEPDESGNHPPLPKELADLSYIDRFGVKAVYGRDELSFGEIQRMITAENIHEAYLARSRAESWAKWAQDNPEADRLLKQVEVMLHDTD